MKKYLLIAVLGLFVLACESESQGDSDTTATDTSAATTANEADGGEEALPRIKPEAKDINVNVPEGESSILAALGDMAYDEAYEIDDFRERLEYDMGEVNSTLLATGAMFEDQGGLLVAKGEVTNEGSIFAAIVVADPGQDVLYGASYDAATKESKKYADKEGAEYPDVIGDWLSSYE